jgi:tocopherol O-methyltransferase
MATAASAARSNAKEKVIDHYDRVSPYYRTLWGEHLHHGYWIRGDESKEQAQLQLIEHLASAAEIPQQAKILDIGCGMGASSLYLARTYQASVTGITISPVQVEMASEAAAQQGLDTQFLLMDAENMQFSQPFDVLWSVESISHYEDCSGFFTSAARLLKKGGVFAITDWFKKDHMTRRDTQKFIEPIEEGMLVKLQLMDEYEGLLAANKLQVVRREILNENCAKTWDLCLDIIKDKSFWELAAQNGKEFLAYLKAFRAMRAGFASGNFVYGLLVARALPGL